MVPLDTMKTRGTRGAYRKEDRIALPPELQKELVEKAAAKYGNCQELAKHLDIPKSSVHYYRIGRLTMPASVLAEMQRIADDEGLRGRIEEMGVTKDRSWATEYAQDVFREICRDRLRLPTKEELMRDEDLRRKAAAIVSYVCAEGSVWMQKERFGEHAANITFAEHEDDLYEHFRSLCNAVFLHDIGPPQMPGNDARAIRGFICPRFIAEWLVYNGVPIGDKAANPSRLPGWVMQSEDRLTWVHAIQPWCDGEGSVKLGSGGKVTGFSMTQSRHTMLDLISLPPRLSHGRSGRFLGRRDIDGAIIHGVPIVTYCYGAYKSDIFEDVFGFGGFGGAGGPHPQQGSDLRYDLTLDFLDAALGTEVTVEVPRVVNCHSCGGTG
ncbi:MAG: hypothetical protein KJ672_06990, partial [Candidatus Thermoplasmatota archaeon]|nr:hypothetical protein [Candidatus Thermoplasmatota archaeon]